jgi:FtsZ-interacting cell division protein YlmF
MRPAGVTTPDEPNEPDAVLVEALSDCGRIVETFRDKGAVIMDVRAIDAATAQRVRDYVVGAAFALRAAASTLGVGVYLVSTRDLPPEQERQLRHRYGS